MSELKNFHCEHCHAEWKGYCPICANCANVAWELPEIEADEYTFIETVDELLGSIERNQEEY